MTRFQQNDWSCSVAAVNNALYAMTGYSPYQQIEELIRPNPVDGADAPKIKEALHSMGYFTEEVETDQGWRAWTWLRSELLDGHPVILCINNWEHYVTACGVLGSKVYIFDPARTFENSVELGSKWWAKHQLLEAWRNAETDGYWGLSVY